RSSATLCTLWRRDPPLIAQERRVPVPSSSVIRPVPALPRARRGPGLRPLDLTAVTLHPHGALGAWQELNASATIPHCIAQLETSGVIDNFRRLIGES